ncbi:hypothetical protein [Pedobacter agri]|uniref:hypothetical protein n=1 Tax=Pedobacter agri TaxID=454586 RepID=UPI002930DA55|nr:hypothetical protein [Pedobacter agri]
MKTFLNDFHLVFFLLTIAILAPFCIYFLKDNKELIAFISVCFGFGAYYFSVWIASAETTFSVEGGEFQIMQYARSLNITRNYSINLSNIRGFSIDDVTRGNKALFIYLDNTEYFKFSFRKVKESEEIKTYLATFINPLSIDTNPNFKSFFQAYLFAVKKVMIFLVLAISLTVFITHYLPFQGYTLVITCLISNVVIWMLTVRKPVKKMFFRYGAFYFFSNVFIYLSPLLAILIYRKVLEIKTEPLKLSKPHELIFKPAHLFYQFDKTVINPNEIQASTYSVSKNSSSRDRFFKVTHYFATPVASVDSIRINARYNLWLVKTFDQKIRKDLDQQLKSNLIQDFHIRYRSKFDSLLNNRPEFYVGDFYNMTAHQLLAGNANATVNNYILIPHWEKIETYKNELQKEVLYLLMAILSLNFLGCVFIAINR